MTIGYLVIAASFLIIVVLLLILVLRPRLSNRTLALLIPFCIWWSSTLYFVPGQFNGYAKRIGSADELPAGVVENFIIQEDRGIYFTVLPSPQETSRRSLSPHQLIDAHRSGEPRVFVVPYSVELHRKLMEIRKAQDETPGGVLLHRGAGNGRRGHADERDSTAPSSFEILNPAEVLRKDLPGGAVHPG